MKDRITIRFPQNQIHLINELEKIAKSENKNLNRFLIENIILALRGCFVVCNKCKWPILDERTIPVIGSIMLKCPKCGNEQEHQID